MSKMSYPDNDGDVAKLVKAAVCKTAIMGPNPIVTSMFVIENTAILD